ELPERIAREALVVAVHLVVADHDRKRIHLLGLVRAARVAVDALQRVPVNLPGALFNHSVHPSPPFRAAPHRRAPVFPAPPRAPSGTPRSHGPPRPAS